MKKYDTTKWKVTIGENWNSVEFIFNNVTEASQFLELAMKNAVDDFIRHNSKMELYIPEETEVAVVE